MKARIFGRIMILVGGLLPSSVGLLTVHGYDVVYDSLSTTVFGGGYVLQPVTNQLGEDLLLGYPAASISQMEFLLKSFSTQHVVDIRVHFYAFDDPNDDFQPGTTLWSSATIHLDVPQIPKMYSLEVPDIVLPRRFGWAIETVSYPGISTGVGFPGVPSPTIGTALGVINYWPQINSNDPWFWQAQGNPQSFGLRLSGEILVPEPTTSLLALATLCLPFRRRR
jgi:hypothetical protein